jgi:tetratricopeptide (TPR) repeat protein
MPEMSAGALGLRLARTNWKLGAAYLIGAGLVAFSGPAKAATDVVYGPAPGWVRPIATPEAAPTVETGAFQILLQDDQARYDDKGDEFYMERAFRVVAPQALSGGNLIQSWNPETETLTVHKLRVVRGAAEIDLLAGGKKLTVLRRETNLERASLDGSLTATLQPEDLRVGDIVDYAITLTRKDPVRQGRSEGFASLHRQGVAARTHIRQLWPASKPMRWRATEGLGDTKLTRTRDGFELTVASEQTPAPRPPRGAPARFRRQGQLEVTEFGDWRDISILMAPLYAKASRLAPDSPVRSEIARIAGASSDPKVRAAAALELVEDQVRYVFLGMNLGGYVPADADVTWARRYGDCKGKTALLLAILHELGIEAEAAAVHSSAGDGMDERLPMLALFDHVLVRARIGGKTYWLDGTGMGDRGVDDIDPPAFRWALPLVQAGAGLVRIEQPPLAVPRSESLLSLDVSAGTAAKAPARVEMVARGAAGAAMKLTMDRLGQQDRDRVLRELVRAGYPWIEVKTVGWSYDEKIGEARTWMDGLATVNWRMNGTVLDFNIVESSIGYDTSFQREPGPSQDAPFAVGHPVFERRQVTVKLPKDSSGFMLVGAADVNATIAGVAYKRISRLKDGVATVEVERRSLAPEFPFAEADAAAAALRNLAQTQVVLRTAVAPAAPPASPVLAEAGDATGYAARAAANMKYGAYDKAIADFSRAAELEPKVGKHIYNRGTAYYAQGADAKALTDFEAAARLSPTDPLPLLARARIHLLQGREAFAVRDFEQAIKLSPTPAEATKQRADAYLEAGRLSEALGFYDTWLLANARDPAAGEVRARRCLIVAKLGRDGALAACEAALAAWDSVWAVEGQAIAQLRAGRPEAAKSFDRLLKMLMGSDAAALYGRGLARLRAGARAEGDADLKAALTLDPTVAASYRRYGLGAR